MEQQEFKPGFEFELRTNADPAKWEKIKIHPNCAPALINELVNIFEMCPKDFRRIKRLTAPATTTLKKMQGANN